MADLFSPNGKPLSLLSARNVSSAYSGKRYGLFGKKTTKKVLDKTSLELAPGEIMGLTGESGCGKTTFAHCILGLVDYEGEIYIEGEKQMTKRHSPLPSARLPLARQVQLVFQESGASLNPVKKIGWLLEEPLAIHGIGDAKERGRQVDEMLESVGLDPSYKTRGVNELSGGQKQRVCIGRALILKPKLLIADEAISSLDVSVAAQILNLLRELHEKLGLGLLFISHNKDAVDYLCDRVAVMKAGKIVDAG
ncbi:MAG: dipeptide/oligopeptide/nickel ABC transporter ATP-binding protein [Spirochaetes bacterium]|nr:dipeptide/oligopeptide/nickel ABC transporter ATP-binding protein [Spirochaetota bacterium]